MTREIFERTAKLLAEHMGRDRSKITAETSLQLDTGMDGLDAEEFLDAYVEEFDVDMAAFRYDRHFGPEGYTPFLPLWYLLSGRRSPPWVSVTVGDLVRSAQAGVWIEPDGPEYRDTALSLLKGFLLEFSFLAALAGAFLAIMWAFETLF